MPKASFTISGEIEDFTRVDNIYKTLKREGNKLFKDWVIDFDVKYQEKQGKGEIPE